MIKQGFSYSSYISLHTKKYLHSQNESKNGWIYFMFNYDKNLIGCEMMPPIGAKVKGIRKQLEMNQIEFSKAINISQGNLSEIEQGNSKPSSETLMALRNNFGVDLNWLLQFEEESEENSIFDSGEVKLLSLYRSLPNDYQEDIIDYVSYKLKKSQIK
ncbi:transcriptional regulator with XRE-family HTH domain [Paenibacillus sp. DS2015]|uniref:helix-turn-helix domain-containing protein n=1 Tax=Paenibacillus sp. DS2015 TaxID=3373917 RepID=UPI003D21F4C5